MVNYIIAIFIGNVARPLRFNLIYFFCYLNSIHIYQSYIVPILLDDGKMKKPSI